MPYINTKVTSKLTEKQKESLKAGLGKVISILPGKTEEVLMVEIEDNCDLWLAGKKLDKGAYVEVSYFGEVDSVYNNKLTAAICELHKNELEIPGTNMYLTYHPISDWGFNGIIVGKKFD